MIAKKNNKNLRIISIQNKQQWMIMYNLPQFHRPFVLKNSSSWSTHEGWYALGQPLKYQDHKLIYFHLIFLKSRFPNSLKFNLKQFITITSSKLILQKCVSIISNHKKTFHIICRSRKCQSCELNFNQYIPKPYVRLPKTTKGEQEKTLGPFWCNYWCNN